MEMSWLKWWDGTATDPKIAMVARECRTAPAVILGIWAYLLEYASRNDDRGSIEGIDFEVMEFALGIGSSDVTQHVTHVTAVTVCNAMKNRKLISDDGRIEKWDKRQKKRERVEDPEKVRARVAKHRQSKRDAGTGDSGHSQNGDDNNGDDVTPGNAAVTPGNATKRPKRREEKNREDKNGSNKSKPELNHQAPAARLPNDWKLPKAYGVWAKDYDPGWSDAYIRELGEAFRDYWCALPDNSRAKKTDWFATWRNFCRQRVKASDQASNGKGSAQRNRFWYSTEQGVLDKLAAEGMKANPGETLAQTVDRIIKKLEADTKKPAQESTETGPGAVLSIPLQDTPTITPEEAVSARQAAMALIAEQKAKRRGGVSADETQGEHSV